jgi:hypothetical protein
VGMKNKRAITAISSPVSYIAFSVLIACTEGLLGRRLKLLPVFRYAQRCPGVIVIVVKPCYAAYLPFVRVTLIVFRTLLFDYVVSRGSALKTVYLFLYVIGDRVSKSVLGKAFF